MKKIMIHVDCYKNAIPMHVGTKFKWLEIYFPNKMIRNWIFIPHYNPFKQKIIPIIN